MTFDPVSFTKKTVIELMAGQITALQHQQMLLEAITGESFRILFANGEEDLVFELVERDSVEFKIAFFDALHELLSAGQRLPNALNQMIDQGWYARMVELDLRKPEGN